MADRVRKIAPMGIFEIKKMLDKVQRIQEWWRGLMKMRIERSKFAKSLKCIILV